MAGENKLSDKALKAYMVNRCRVKRCWPMDGNCPPESV